MIQVRLEEKDDTSKFFVISGEKSTYIHCLKKYTPHIAPAFLRYVKVFG